MARMLGLALALAALLVAPSGAIVFRDVGDVLTLTEGENATKEPSPEQLLAVGKALKIATNGTFNATGNESVVPFIASTVQLALTAIVDPVAQTCKEIQRWVYTKMIDLKEGVNATKAFPDQALMDFASRFSVLFKYVRERLSMITTKLTSVAPALQTVKGLMEQLGFEGSIQNVENVLTSMSNQINHYDDILQNSTEICDSLKNLTKSDWKLAGAKLHKLKAYLDNGAATVRKFGDTLEMRLDGAIRFLANRLHDDPEKFNPFKENVNASWVDLEDSADHMAIGLQSAAQMLPPELAVAIPESGACGARGFLGAAAVAVASALAF